jgi:hypothetical protein
MGIFTRVILNVKKRFLLETVFYFYKNVYKFILNYLLYKYKQIHI